MTAAPLTFAEKSTPGRLLIWGLLLYAIAGNFSISLSQTALGLALIGTLLLWRCNRLELKAAPLTGPFLFMGLAGLLSVFVADDKMRAITEMKKFLVLPVFFIAWWAPISSGVKKKLLLAFIITASVTATLALTDVALGKMLNDRARGFFSTSITFGECQAMVAMVITAWLLAGTHGKAAFTGLFTALLLVTGSMISTMSRGAWLGFAAGILVLTIRFPRKMLPIMLLLAMTAGPVIWFTPALRSRIEAFNISKNIEALQQPMDGNFDSAAMASNYLRLNIWQRGFKMTENRSIFGVGMNNGKKKFYELASDYERQYDFLIFGHQHSNFMQIYAMTGLIGLCAFFIFLVATFKFMFKSAANAASTWNSSISLGAVAVFAAFIMTGLTEYSWGDEEVAMMAFFTTGLLLNPTVPEPETL